jgi:C1A family cysteine protease
LHKLIISLFLLMILPLYSKTTVEQIQDAISAKNAHWKTGASWVSALSKEEFKHLCGASLDVPADVASHFITLRKTEALPAQFDWRDNNGNWVTPVRNQGNCGSCWDFSAVAQVEAWWQIRNSKPNSGINLSEQFVLSCGQSGTCDGGGVEQALTFFQNTGVPPEACFPYRADDALPCSEACADWQSQAVTIPGWGYITRNEILIDNIKVAVYRHPVSASYTVFDDFQFYGGGVYQHVWGDVAGSHAILIVGWDDAEQCWICKNSWDQDWGEAGYFRIKWYDSGMGTNVPFIYSSLISDAVALSVDFLNLSLTPGEISRTSVTLNNKSAGELEYALFDCEVPQIFHCDLFNAYDIFSWWCGSAEIGGYADHWLQYLDTPAIDLSSTSQPQLSFMTFWAVEPPHGAEAPWDGWDGANVWVSTDAGASFHVMTPKSPAYTCKSLWSFGEAEQGWNMGTGIAGWAGSSDGWQQATFDLQPYISSHTVIRFAFASDMGFSTLDDPAMLGFFVDAIKVTDGASLLYSNDGDDGSSMYRSGSGSSPAAWINLSSGVGVLPHGETKEIGLDISAASLSPGDYAGFLEVASNDSSAVGFKLPINLRVTRPATDAALFPRYSLSERLFVGSLFASSALVRNLGESQLNEGVITREIYQAEKPCLTDTIQWHGLLESMQYLDFKFQDWAMPDTGIFKVMLRNVPPAGDTRADNDSASFTLHCTSLVDDFEGAEEWDFKGGWGVTDFYGAHSGTSAAHCSNDAIPYSPNMNAIMTIKQSFDIASLDSVSLSYWASAFVEIGKDMCFLEISTDSFNWTPVDTVSNQNMEYEQYIVPISSYLRVDDLRLWIRFRFVSNGTDESAGVFIDDVHFYARPRKIISEIEAPPAASTPLDWQLSNNYPNPFNGSTRIRYSMKEPAKVELTVFNVNGKLVQTLAQEYQAAGEHIVFWRPMNLASGIYFYKMTATTEQGHTFEAMNKMLLIK